MSGYLNRGVVLIVVFLLGACNDIITSHYDSYKDAKAEKIFLKGWLPDILPKSTTGILTSNDLDNNSSTGYFSIPIHDLDKFKVQLERVSENVYSFESKLRSSIWMFNITKKGYVSYVLMYFCIEKRKKTFAPRWEI